IPSSTSINGEGSDADLRELPVLDLRSKPCRDRVGGKESIRESVTERFSEFHVIRHVLGDRKRNRQHSERRLATSGCQFEHQAALPDAPITQGRERGHAARDGAVSKRVSEAFDIVLPTDEFVWSHRKIGLWKHEIAILTKRTILNVSFCSFCYFGVAFGDG